MADLDNISNAFGKSYLDFGEILEHHRQTKMMSTLFNRQRPRRYYDFPDDLLLENEDSYSCINVPDINVCSGITLADAVSRRRTSVFDDYSGGWTENQLYTFLNLTAGITGKKEYYSYNSKKEKTFHVQKLRAYPSGGGLYPVELYLYIKDIEGIADGLYLWNPMRSRLIFLKEPLEKDELEALLPMTSVKIDPNNASLDKCNIITFLVANFRYSSYKYGKLAYKLAILEAGHIGQNIQLAVTALDKKSTALCGYYDDKVEEYLELDGREKTCLYVFTIG